MFMLYVVLIGLVVGFGLGGRPSGLANLRFRWAPVILGGLFAQLILFSDAVARQIGEFGAPIYVLSTLAVLAAVLRNTAIRGLPIVAIGAASNFVAIVANGGYMPVSAGAVEAQGRAAATVYSNSRLLAEPGLAALTDMFALPTWVPFSNVFSVGDVLIGLGVAVVLVSGMRARSPEMAPARPPDPGSR